MIFNLVLVLGLTSVTLAATILYAAIAPWWKSLMGRALMFLLVCMDSILGLSSVAKLTGGFPYLLEFSRAAYILMIIAVAGFGVVMVKEQRAGRRRRENKRNAAR